MMSAGSNDMMSPWPNPLKAKNGWLRALPLRSTLLMLVYRWYFMSAKSFWDASVFKHIAGERMLKRIEDFFKIVGDQGFGVVVE